MENTLHIQAENTPSLFFAVNDKGQHVGTYWKTEGKGQALYSEQVEIEQAERPAYFNDAGFLDFDKLKAVHDARADLDNQLTEQINRIIDAATVAAGGAKAYPAEAVRNFERYDNGSVQLLESMPVEDYWQALYPPVAVEAWQGAGLALKKGSKPLRRDNGDILPAYIHDAVKWWERYDAHREKAGHDELSERLESNMHRKYIIKQAMKRAPAVTLEQVAHKAGLLAECVKVYHERDQALAASLITDIENLSGETT